MITYNHTLPNILCDWVARSFGRNVLDNHAERGLRHAEEAIEFAQAMGASRELVLQVLDQVYSKPAGEPRQEAAGSLFTLIVACSICNINLQNAFEEEIRRVLDLPPEHFKARHRQKPHAEGAVEPT